MGCDPLCHRHVDVYVKQTGNQFSPCTVCIPSWCIYSTPKITQVLTLSHSKENKGQLPSIGAQWQHRGPSGSIEPSGSTAQVQQHPASCKNITKSVMPGGQFWQHMGIYLTPGSAYYKSQPFSVFIPFFLLGGSSR